MKFSEMWLREWIDPPIDHEELINQLTMIGFNVTSSKSISGKFSGVVIGKIVQYKKHPHVNNVWVLKVDNGSNDLINIVCNDINHCNNFKVVIAKVGALLPNGQTVRSTIIHGTKSEGILCTFSILGLNGYGNGIIKFPENDTLIGYDFYDYLNLNDNIIDVDITPNRGDCLNVVGIAREIAAINKLKIKTIKIEQIKPTITDIISVKIENSNICPQFFGKVLKNINTTIPTPIRIKERLYRCGIKPKNIVLDIINYVTLELGHPIYAFDYEKICQNTIYIRFSKLKEILVLQNNTHLQLSTNTLIIADHKKPLSVAGITIDHESNVSYETQHIFLQSAFFNPKNIAKKSRSYNKLDTFFFTRYERGVDPNTSELALDYATSLLLNFCNGNAGPTTKIINQNTLPKSNTIILHRSKLDAVLGFHIDDYLVLNILTNLGFTVKTVNTAWVVSTPTWRFDISIEENLISEIIRIYGYTNIPLIPANICLTKPQSQNVTCHINTNALSKAKITLINRGYQEIITYSFVNPDLQKILHPQYTPLTLTNPISLDMSVMRLSLWTGLIKTVIYNQNRQQKHIRLFESGICFVPMKTTCNNQILQKLMISGIRSESQLKENWYFKSSLDFYDIKGDIEALLNITNKFKDNIIFKHCINSTLHPKKSAAIYFNNVLIGYVGMIHPLIQTKLNLYLDTLIFELSWDAVIQSIPTKITNISKFPKNYRDISLLIPTNINAMDIVIGCKQNKINYVTDLKIIDVYLNKNIPKNYKSLTVKLTLQGKTHTLTDQEINNSINQCITFFKKRFSAILR